MVETALFAESHKDGTTDSANVYQTAETMKIKITITMHASANLDILEPTPMMSASTNVPKTKSGVLQDVGAEMDVVDTTDHALLALLTPKLLAVSAPATEIISGTQRSTPATC